MNIIDLGKLRFNFAGDWLATTPYEPNDCVKYGGNVYCYIGMYVTSGNLPTNALYWTLMIQGLSFTGVFDAARPYRIGEAIAHGGNVYVAIADSIGQTPPSVANWRQFAFGVRWMGDYNPAQPYKKDDIVRYGGATYLAIADGVGNAPTQVAFWASFTSGIRWRGTWATGVPYLPSDIVTNGISTYMVVVAHTSGATIQADITAGNIEVIASGAAGVPVVSTQTAGGSLTNDGINITWRRDYSLSLNAAGLIQSKLMFRGL